MASYEPIPEAVFATQPQPRVVADYEAFPNQNQAEEPFEESWYCLPVGILVEIFVCSAETCMKVFNIRGRNAEY